jgi:hypothetical protein
VFSQSLPPHPHQSTTHIPPTPTPTHPSPPPIAAASVIFMFPRWRRCDGVADAGASPTTGEKTKGSFVLGYHAVAYTRRPGSSPSDVFVGDRVGSGLAPCHLYTMLSSHLSAACACCRADGDGASRLGPRDVQGCVCTALQAASHVLCFLIPPTTPVY